MARWRFSVTLDPSSPVAVYAQIARALTDDIRRGRLRANDPLPGSRALAQTLGVHRNTVLAAYDALRAEGWISAEPGAATRVTAAMPDARPRREPTRSPARVGFAVAGGAEDPDESGALQGLVRISDGTPDPRTLPSLALSRALRAALRAGGTEVLGYGHPAGHPGLRAGVAQMLSEARGVAATPDDVVITAGSQGALDLLARALIRPGDRVAVERLGYRPAWDALRAAGAALVPVAVDDDGMRVEDLDALGPLRAVYLTPQHQYPCTVTLSAARRVRLLDLARARGVAVFEDDYDHEFHYDARPVLPLASADRAGVVCYVGSLSKVVAPGLRVGWLHAPAPVVREVVRLRTIAGRHNDGPMQHALAGLLDEGELQRQVRRVRRVLHARRDAALEAVREVFGARLEVRPPAGGMTLWATVPGGVELAGWKRAAREAGLHLRVGAEFDLEGRETPALRLGYGQMDERAFRAALKTLGRVMPRGPAARRPSREARATHPGRSGIEATRA
jgi:GntR family transcriptional regulator/MocR family aminotransferase